MHICLFCVEFGEGIEQCSGTMIILVTPLHFPSAETSYKVGRCYSEVSEEV